MSTIDESFECLAATESRIKKLLAQARQLNAETASAECQSCHEDRKSHHEKFEAMQAEIRQARIENSRVLDQLEARNRQHQDKESRPMTTERWTDERLDRLAGLAESNLVAIREQREAISELRESSREQREDIASLQITTTALLQLAQQSQQKWEQSMALHEESDQRFEILLAEVRHLISRMDGV
jgi:chromosome segregation ATPase